jgi:hypothetical protein
MADSRQGPLVIGVLTAITGGVLFLAAGDVLPVEDKTFGAPRWLVSLFALGVFFGGFYLLALVLPTPRMRRVLGGAAVLAFLSTVAVLMTWLAITGGGPSRPPMPARPGALVLPPEIGRTVMRVFAGLFAVPLDAIALGAWFIALRWLVRRPPP